MLVNINYYNIISMGETEYTAAVLFNNHHFVFSSAEVTNESI